MIVIFIFNIISIVIVIIIDIIIGLVTSYCTVPSAIEQKYEKWEKYTILHKDNCDN